MCIRDSNDSGDDVATSCKNLVNFRLVTPEIMELICIPKYPYLAKIDLHICIRRGSQCSPGTCGESNYGTYMHRGVDQWVVRGTFPPYF